MADQPYQPQGFCPYCDYPTDVGRCPECGRMLATVMAVPCKTRRRRWVRRGTVLAVVLAASFAIWQFGPALAERCWPTWHLRRLVDADERRPEGTSPSGLASWAKGVCIRRWQASVSREQGPAADRQRKIESELRANPNPQWAGFYATAPRLRVFVLSIAPESGYTLSVVENGRSRFETHGEIIEVTNDRMRVRSAIDPDLNLPSGFAELVITRWNGAICLVPANEMIQFCNDANAGIAFPFSSSWYSPIVVADGHFDPAVECEWTITDRFGWQLPEMLPMVPAEYRQMILPNPVNGSIIEVLGTRVKKRSGVTRSYFQCRLNVGSNDGLLGIMQFYKWENDRLWMGEVASVEPSSCVVELFAWPDATQVAPPEIGWEFSTRHPDPRFPRLPTSHAPQSR